MVLGLGVSTEVSPLSVEEPQLNLLTELRPWGEVFRENLVDTLLLREPPRVWTMSRPAKFWSDVFVPSGIPWSRMRQSMFLHLLVAVCLWAGSDLWDRMLQQQTPTLRLHDKVYYYKVTEFLPPLDTGSPPAPIARKGEPLLAKQKIISLRPNADKHEQTIISPLNVKLPANVPLPNIVAWTPTPGVPSAAATRTAAQLKLPEIPLNVVEPAPDPVSRSVSGLRLPADALKIIEAPPSTDGLHTSRRLDVSTNVIEPPPTVDNANLHTRAINAPVPAVIEPPPDANMSRNIGAMSIGHLAQAVEAPRMPVPEQRAMQLRQGTGSLRGANGKGSGNAGGRGAAAPAPPSVGTLANGSVAGQLIALNLHPMPGGGAISVPPGNRSGEFAAGPEGKPNAPGTPDIKGTATGSGGSGTGTAGAGKGNASSLPSGLTIGTAPGAPPPGSVVVSGPAEKTVASVQPPRVGDVSHETRPSSGAPDAPRIAERVFNGKRSYMMALNMPNLTSAGGSWIIRFAELDDSKTPGDVAAPIAMTKVDPAYPMELIRDGVEGTVILYAVIHKDGTVGEVRVLRGVQGRLDESARSALARWKFHPGTKNGEAVDLEAVVQIPFKAAHMHF
jgi:TonB family protein